MRDDIFLLQDLSGAYSHTLIERVYEGIEQLTAAAPYTSQSTYIIRANVLLLNAITRSINPDDGFYLLKPIGPLNDIPTFESPWGRVLFCRDLKSDPSELVLLEPWHPGRVALRPTALIDLRRPEANSTGTDG
jgi:hypothetical protein